MLWPLQRSVKVLVDWGLQNDSLATLLARMESILGPLPRWMLRKGRYSHRFFTRAGVLYEQARDTVRALTSSIVELLARYLLACCSPSSK